MKVNRRYLDPNSLSLGVIDIDPRFDYLVVYVNKKSQTVNTWALPGSSLKSNVQSMMKNEEMEIVGIYKHLTNVEIMKEIEF